MTTLVEICGLPLVHALGWTLLHLCWQGTVVAVVLWCVLGLLGGRSSRARYVAACLALGLMIALPLVTFAHLASVEYQLRAAFDGPAVAIESGMVLRVRAGELSAPWPVQMAVALDHALPWILLAWFAGVILFVGRLNVGLLVARRMRSAGTTAAPAELQQVFEAVRRRLGIARAVRLMHSALVQAPTVIGWLRPVVLIPASCLTGLSTMQIEAILAHELAHIRRHDYLVSVLQSMVETLLFYHPAVWWVSKQIRRERECCCDELAVAVGGDRLAYARALSVLEERRSFYPEVALGANGGVLKMRIKRLLGCKEDAAVSQFAAFTVLALIVALAGSYGLTVARAESGAVSHAARAASPMDLEPAAPLNTLIASPAVRQFQLKEPVLMAQAEAPAAGAAQVDGAIAGSIVDQTGAVVPGAKVTSVNTDNGTQVSSETDNSGTYSISPLQTGPYNVEVVAKGFQRMLQENVHVDSGKTVGLNLKLTVDQGSGAQLVPAAPAYRLLQASPGGQVRVSAAVVAGMALSKPDPVYPAEAKAAHVQGAVILHAIISKTGTVENLQVISGPTMLVASAMDAVKQWTYKPYLLNGQPVEVETSITVNYTFGGPTNVVGPVPPADEASAGVKQIGGGVTGPVVIYQPDPEFTKEGRKAKVQGVVTVSLVVDEHGQPQNVHIVRGMGIGTDGRPDPKLKKAARKAADGMNQSAVDAVKQYKFKPAMENGRPVSVYLNVEVNFEIF
jgi:TonB family protein